MKKIKYLIFLFFIFINFSSVNAQYVPPEPPPKVYPVYVPPAKSSADAKSDYEKSHYPATNYNNGSYSPANNNSSSNNSRSNSSSIPSSPTPFVGKVYKENPAKIAALLKLPLFCDSCKVLEKIAHYYLFPDPWEYEEMVEFVSTYINPDLTKLSWEHFSFLYSGLETALKFTRQDAKLKELHDKYELRYKEARSIIEAKN